MLGKCAPWSTPGQRPSCRSCFGTHCPHQPGCVPPVPGALLLLYRLPYFSCDTWICHPLPKWGRTRSSKWSCLTSLREQCLGFLSSRLSHRCWADFSENMACVWQKTSTVRQLFCSVLIIEENTLEAHLSGSCQKCGKAFKRNLIFFR